MIIEHKIRLLISSQHEIEAIIQHQQEYFVSFTA